MTFDETLYGRGSDDGDDFGDNESFDDVIDDEEEELEDEEDEPEEEEEGYAEDDAVAPSASRAQRDEEASEAEHEPALRKRSPPRKQPGNPLPRKLLRRAPAKKAAQKGCRQEHS